MKKYSALIPLTFTLMKSRFFVPALLAGCLLFSATGCAVLSKGRTQTVVVRSTPEGATGLINGIEVGKTPFKVKLKRTSAYSIELRKTDFKNSSVVILPVANEYEKSTFRWGVDYDLGAMTDLSPSEVNVTLKPFNAQEATQEERFKEMSYKVLQADALLSAKEITPENHKAMVDEIVKFYTN